MKASNGYTILIIDDDPTLRLIAEKKLTRQGYKVLTAATGEEGIKVALGQVPDLLLLDYDLPDISGVEVCQYLRNHAIIVDNPILFITGNDDYESIEKAFEVGATDFSSKPLNWNILNYRIKYLLRSHEIHLSLLSSEAKLTKAQKIAKIANWDYNSENHRFSWSDTIYDMLQINKQKEHQFGLEDFLQYVPLEDKQRVRNAIDNSLTNFLGFEIEHQLVTSSGDLKTISHLGNVIKNDDNNSFDCIGTLQDITERRETENQFKQLAYYDSLTGLMNRESFLTALEKVISSNSSFDLLSALFFIDLDDFKRVNDTLGHDFGDSLLCEVAERLKNCIRTAESDKEYNLNNQRDVTNHLTDSVFRVSSIEINRFDLGRLGGDEFTIFLADIADEEVARSVASRLLKSLEQPFDINGNKLYVTFSIGISVSPYDGDSIQSLLKNADTAMYVAKAKGKNNYQFYTREMNESSLYRLSLESDLRKAIAKDELYLVYQPQVDLKTGKLIGAEALMRWEHEVKGNISPVDFIPLAEQTGQILILGNWLFSQFSKDLQNWYQQGLIPEGFKLGVNVSSLQFCQLNMMDRVNEYFSDPVLSQYVEFELTESVMMKNVEDNRGKLIALKEKKISLAIDDFGTGYSSLSYLHSFPVDTVKIDRSFISTMEKDGQTNIVKAIIAMAHGMDIKVIAEGIETQWQYDFLRNEQCDIGQGYLIDRPLAKPVFQELLENSNS